MHVFVVLAGLIFGTFALGQTGNASDATVRGVVTTGWPDYRPLSNVTVLAESPVDVRTTRTDAQGRYLFLTLIPGVYRISVGDERMAGQRRAVVMVGTSNPHGVVTSSGVPVFVGSKSNLKRCMAEANSLVALSAGIEYEADIELTTRCR